jgi:hypothetical protein
MIIKAQDIRLYITKSNFGELTIIENIKLHIPTGVFFSYNENYKTKEYLYLKVGQISESGEIESAKSFDGFNMKSFFEAVDYFEELINERMPQEKPEQPIYSYFYFIKSKDSFVKFVNGSEDLIIDREDLEKMFTPPLKKPYGRLDGTAVEKEKYEVIKSKFALNFDEIKTNEFLEENNLSTGDVYVYEMTAYQNSEENGEPTPKGVNDDSMSIDQIEGEEPQNMEGSDKEMPDSDSKDEDSNDADSKNNDKNDSQQESDESDSEQELNERDADDNLDQSLEGNSDETSSEISDKDNKDNDQNPENGTQSNQSDEDITNSSSEKSEEELNAIEKVGKFLNSDDLVYDLKTKTKVLSLLNTYSIEDLNPLIKSFNLNNETNKGELFVYISENIDKFF